MGGVKYFGFGICSLGCQAWGLESLGSVNKGTKATKRSSVRTLKGGWGGDNSERFAPLGVVLQGPDDGHSGLQHEALERIAGFVLGSYWLKTQLFNFWASCKVVYSESSNFYFLGFWARKGFVDEEFRVFC